MEHLSFGLDVRCFFGTIAAVLKHDGVVEGGTGTLHENNKNLDLSPEKRIIKQYKTLKEDSYGTHLYQ